MNKEDLEKLLDAEIEYFKHRLSPYQRFKNWFDYYILSNLRKLRKGKGKGIAAFILGVPRKFFQYNFLWAGWEAPRKGRAPVNPQTSPAFKKIREEFKGEIGKMFEEAGESVCPDSEIIAKYALDELDEKTAQNVRVHLLFCNQHCNEEIKMVRSLNEQS